MPYMNYDNYLLLFLFIFAVVPDDDQLPQHEQDNIPPRSCTPPTPPVEADQPSPPPLPPPVRARAMGQLRPVFLLNLLKLLFVLLALFMLLLLFNMIYIVLIT